MKNCIFCKIAKGEINSAKIWEDKDFLAILDLNPNVDVQSLVLPKKHFSSDIFLLDGEIYQNFFLAAKKVAEILKEKLKLRRIAIVIEGMGVDHAHIKLYPLYGVEKFKPVIPKEKVFFKKYPGYITTKLGPRRTLLELKNSAKKLKK